MVGVGVRAAKFTVGESRRRAEAGAVESAVGGGRGSDLAGVGAVRTHLAGAACGAVHDAYVARTDASFAAFVGRRPAATVRAAEGGRRRFGVAAGRMRVAGRRAGTEAGVVTKVDRRIESLVRADLVAVEVDWRWWAVT